MHSVQRELPVSEKKERILLVDNDKNLLKDAYIKSWYKVSKHIFSQFGL